jgi:PII-like signaling protein
MVPVMAEGGGVTVTVAVAGTLHPQTVVERLYTYVPVVVGVIDVEEQVEQDTEVGPVHE